MLANGNGAHRTFGPPYSAEENKRLRAIQERGGSARDILEEIRKTRPHVTMSAAYSWATSYGRPYGRPLKKKRPSKAVSQHGPTRPSPVATTEPRTALDVSLTIQVPGAGPVTFGISRETAKAVIKLLVGV